MRAPHPVLGLAAVIPALSLNLLPTCGGGGGGGGGGTSDITKLETEPNDTALMPSSLKVGIPVRGDMIPTGDVDWYFSRLRAGSSVRLELWAARLDQAAWDAVGTVPAVTVYFPTMDLALVEQGFRAGWTFGALDFEMPSYRLPTNGPNFWIKVEPELSGSAGGRYAIRISYAFPGPLQLETEEPHDIGGNDTAGTAQRIVPGAVQAFHRDLNDDYYSIAVAGPTVLRLEVLSERNGAPTGELTPYDPLLRLYDVGGLTPLAENDDALASDPAIQYAVGAAGVYSFQVTQSPLSTVSGPYRLLVSTSPALGTPETEPNDAFSTASPFAYGQNVSGTIAPGQDDWFRFTGTTGDMVRLQVFDKNDSRSSSEAVVVTLVGSDGSTPLTFHEGPLFQVLTTILQQSGTTFVHVQPDPAASGATSYRLELRRFHAAVAETEPNDSLAQAHAFPGGGYAAGVIGTPGDVDVYRFGALGEQIVTFDVYAGNTATGTDAMSEYSGHGSALAPLLSVRDVNGVPLATSTSLPVNGIYTESVSDALPTAAVTFVAPPTSHVFYVEVASADGTGGPDHYYVLRKR